MDAAIVPERSSVSSQPGRLASELKEAFLELCDMARCEKTRIPAELLAQQVLAVTEGGDWPVQCAAMEAISRRFEFAKRDELRVERRPKGLPFGEYQLKRRGHRTVRPYTTMMWSVSPFGGSCDCPDFLRSSLGVCKHLLLAWDDACSRRKGSWEQVEAAPPALRWDPVRPLLGRVDWLEGVRWDDTLPKNGRAPLAVMRMRRWFASGAGVERRLKNTSIADVEKRGTIVEDLLAAAGLRSVSCDPALVRLLKQEREVLARRTSMQGLHKHLQKSLRGFRRDLYPYQLEGVQRFLETGRLLLGDEMGLGKTVQASAICQVLFSAKVVRRGLLIVPASLKSQWLREWQAMTDVPIAMVEGRPDERRRQYSEWKSGFLITNYEQLLRDVRLVMEAKPDFVVLDEAQRIKNWTTKTATYVKSLTPQYRLVLTGTPLENRLEELASLLDWVDDTVLAPKWRLGPWHTLWHTDATEHSRVGVRHLDTLRARLEPVMLRRTRAQVLTQLPPRTDVWVPVEMMPQQAEAHDELEFPIRRLVHTSRRRPLTQAEFLRLMSLLTQQRVISNGLAQFLFEEVWPECSRARPDERRIDRLCSPKLHELRRLITEIAIHQQRKVVVFSQWRRMLRLAHWAVSEDLREHGVRATFFTGAESQKLRTQSVVDFHDDPNVRVLFLTDAGGVGLNLQRAASSCINIELPWNPAVLEQRIGRVHRIGQDRPIDVYYLATEKGIEARMRGIVTNKRALFTGLFDGDSDEIRFDSNASFLSQLEVLFDAAEAPELEAEPLLLPPHEDEEDPDVAEGNGAAESSASEAPEPNASRTPAADLAGLFSAISLARGEDGRLTLDAPPEAADALLLMLEKTAELLRGAVRRDG